MKQINILFFNTLPHVTTITFARYWFATAKTLHLIRNFLVICLLMNRIMFILQLLLSYQGENNSFLHLILFYPIILQFTLTLLSSAVHCYCTVLHSSQLKRERTIFNVLTFGASVRRNVQRCKTEAGKTADKWCLRSRWCMKAIDLKEAGSNPNLLLIYS